MALLLLPLSLGRRWPTRLQHALQHASPHPLPAHIFRKRHVGQLVYVAHEACRAVPGLIRAPLPLGRVWVPCPNELRTRGRSSLLWLVGELRAGADTAHLALQMLPVLTERDIHVEAVGTCHGNRFSCFLKRVQTSSSWSSSPHFSGKLRQCTGQHRVQSMLRTYC